MMQFRLSRRTLLTGSLALSAAAPIFGLWSDAAKAAAPPALDPNDPTAKALGFVNDAKSVDIAANRTFKPTQKSAGPVRSIRARRAIPLLPALLFTRVRACQRRVGAKLWALKPGS